MAPSPSPRFKTAWIIGASSGIGRELALLLASAGTRVFASARRADLLDELARQQPSITARPVDVVDAERLAECNDDMVGQCGSLDLVVINAAIYQPMLTCEVAAAAAAEHIAVNLQGAVNCAAAVLPGMMKRGAPARLVFVASIAGWRGLPNSGFYAATKAGLISYAESLRAELQGGPVVVQTVCPGFVDTPMVRKNRFRMPLMISAPAAARAIMRGLKGKRFEIHFPARLTWPVKMVSLLPYALYFPVIRMLTGVTGERHERDS